MTLGWARHRGLAFAVAILGVAGCVMWFAQLAGGRVLSPATFALAAAALGANIVSARWGPTLKLSGSLVVALLTSAFVGPAAAFVVVVVAEGVGWLVERLRPIALPLNVLALGLPAIAVGVALDALFPSRAAAGAGFYLGFGALVALASVVNLLIISAVHLLHDGGSLRTYLQAFERLAPVWALNIGATVAIASIYGTLGTAAAGLLVLALLAFTYQARLVARAEDRTRRYAALSWGVLSGMLRNLDQRDRRTARHSAAVARFAADIAAAAGMSEQQQELAHTAGLLHDIGKFALADRVMEGEHLTDDDWRAIKRHPDLGAAMLTDLGVYGPIAAIIRAHHERPDGRGYPDGLGGDRIPEIAKIVAVAEVYDTLTAEDSYRPTMSSFEALREMRRVADRQLDARYVETLAKVLEGKDLAYRQAATADFDRELAIERRIGEAAEGDRLGV